jgi:N-methylhydantoinase A
MFDTLVAQARADLRSDGFSEDRVRVQRALDMRYAGQGYEMTLPIGEAPMDAATLAALRMRFDEQHRAMFGHSAPEEPVEVVSYRVRGVGLVPPVEMPRFAPTGATLEAARREIRRVRFDGTDIDCPVYQRELIDVGATIAGPAILDQFDATTVLCPGQMATVDEYKNLIVRMA